MTIYLTLVTSRTDPARQTAQITLPRLPVTVRGIEAMRATRVFTHHAKESGTTSYVMKQENSLNICHCIPSSLFLRLCFNVILEQEVIKIKTPLTCLPCNLSPSIRRYSCLDRIRLRDHMRRHWSTVHTSSHSPYRNIHYRTLGVMECYNNINIIDDIN